MFFPTLGWLTTCPSPVLWRLVHSSSSSSIALEVSMSGGGRGRTPSSSRHSIIASPNSPAASFLAVRSNSARRNAAYSTFSTVFVHVSANSKMESSQRMRESVWCPRESSSHASHACCRASSRSRGSSSSSNARLIFVMMATYRRLLMAVVGVLPRSSSWSSYARSSAARLAAANEPVSAASHQTFSSANTSLSRRRLARTESICSVCISSSPCSCQRSLAISAASCTCVTGLVLGMPRLRDCGRLLACKKRRVALARSCTGYRPSFCDARCAEIGDSLAFLGKVRHSCFRRSISTMISVRTPSLDASRVGMPSSSI